MWERLSTSAQSTYAMNGRNLTMLNKPIIPILASVLAISLMPAQSLAWGGCHSFSGSGRFGGSFSHSSSSFGGFGHFGHSGSTTYTSPTGRSYSTSHAGYGGYGYGGAHYSGTASYHGAYYGGTAHYHGTAYHGGYYGFHGYSYNTSSSCSNGTAFAIGAATGAVVGAAVASAHTPSTVYVAPAPGVYVQPAPVAVVEPYAEPAVVVHPALTIGSTVTVLPAGFKSLNVNGAQYYQSGPTWYQMKVGGNGVYFVVVPAP